MKLFGKIEGFISMLVLSILLNPGIAEAINWSEFSGSVNKGFSNENIYDSNKILALLLSLMAVVIIIALFRWYSDKEQREQQTSYKKYKERQKEAASKSLNQAHNRKWFRLRTEAELRWIPAGQAGKVKESRYFVDNLVDISAEGLCFSSIEPVETGTEIRFLVDTGEGHVLPILGRVLRISQANSEEDEKRNIAVQFSYMPPGDNDRLVSWIMKRQRDAIHQNTTD